MKKLFDWLKQIGKVILKGIYRFPVTVVCALAVMVIGLVLLHNETTLSEDTMSWLNRISSVLALGIPTSVALQLFFERKEGRPIWLIATLWASLAVLLALYMVFLLPGPLFSNMETMIRYIGVYLAAILMVIVASHFPKKEGDERFAQKLVWRSFITAVFTGILIGGISLVLLMLDKLLNIDIGDKAYLDNIIICSLLFAPSFFLAGVPTKGTNPNEEPFSQLGKVLIGYIIFPLLSVYTIIVYSYFVRILIMQSWPSNTLVNLVLWYTTVGVLSLYFMRSQSEENSWFRLFDRWYPRFTALPIILMFIGLFIRINAYGFTEARYMVLALSIWVACITAISILLKPKRRLNIIVPSLLAMLALITVLGPISAFNVSKISQNARLDALLQQNNMLAADGHIQKGTNVPEKDRRSIYSIIDYFANNHSLSDSPALETISEDNDYTSTLGFERPQDIAIPGEIDFRYIGIDEGLSNVIDVQGYDYFYTNNYGKFEPTTDSNFNIDINDDNIFTLSLHGTKIYSKPLNDFIAELDKNYVEGKAYTQDELTFIDENNLVKVKYLFQHISADYSNSGTPSYYIDSFYALVDIK